LPEVTSSEWLIVMCQAGRRTLLTHCFYFLLKMLDFVIKTSL